MHTVKVSIVMPVYNSERYIEKSILSIINQTFQEFELIIINDGSTDSSSDIISSFKDDRIKIFNNEENKGLIYSLNKGFALCNGEYIARFDADDISLPTRLSEQVNYLEKHKEICLVSSSAIIFLDKYPFIRKRVILNKAFDDIKSELLFRNKLVYHPSVMLRSSIIKSNKYRYNNEHQMCEDFGLWQLLSMKNRIEIIKTPLIKYRISKSSITSNSRKDIEFKNSMKKIYKQGLDLLGIDFTQVELDIHTEISMVSRIKRPNFSLMEKEKWLKKIIEFNNFANIYNIQSLQNITSEMFYLNCLHWGNYSEYKNSIFYKLNSKSRLDFFVNKAKNEIIRMLNRVFR